ncbi:MAG: AAA family ATPase [Acidimicrobiales bacterium]
MTAASDRILAALPQPDEPPLSDDPGPTEPPDLAGPERGPPSSWLPVDLGPAVRGEQAEATPGILSRSDGLGLFYAGKVHGVAGEPESGKSWLAQWGAAEVLKTGGKVAYFDFEDNEFGVVARLLALGCTAERILTGFVYVRPDEALSADNGHLLDEACAGAVLVILDGTTEAMALHGWKPKDDIDSALFQGRILRRMSASGAAVVVIDHVVKDREARGRFATGSQHKLAGVDGAQYLVDIRKRWAPGRSGVARITVTKDRPGQVRAGLADLSTVGDMVVTSWPDGGVSIEIRPPLASTTATDGGSRPTVLMERTSTFMAAHDTEEVSTNRVRQGVKGNDGGIDRALEVLVSEGFVTVTTVGRSRYFRHGKPYSQDADPLILAQTEGDENASDE